MPRAPAKPKTEARSTVADELADVLTAAEKRLATLRKQAEKAAQQLAASRRGADELPEVEPPAPADRPDPARLLKLMADSGALANEQVELFQSAAESTTDKILRAAFEEGRQAAHKHHQALEARAKQLQGSLSGGRTLLGQLVTRVMDVLQKPSDDADRATHFLLRGIAASETAAAVYVALRAAALASGDDSTAALAAAHYGHERQRGDMMRGHVSRIASEK